MSIEETNREYLLNKAYILADEIVRCSNLSLTDDQHTLLREEIGHIANSYVDVLLPQQLQPKDTKGQLKDVVKFLISLYRDLIRYPYESSRRTNAEHQ